MKIGLIGCGFIGEKRLKALPQTDSALMVYDIDNNRSKYLADQFGALVADSPEQILTNPEITAVIIATAHDSLANFTRLALINDKHVLVEKPAARNCDELEAVLEVFEESQNSGRHLVVKVGFNHRFHPAFIKAREILHENKDIAGRMIMIRARYGHGGRIGYEKEWRANPIISGGGELLDQGMHLIDLSRMFMGDFEKIQGVTKTLFWDMPVDDNAFLTLETAHNQVAHLQVSWTEWKNLFSFELYTETIKLQVDGLGGSYGPEKLTYFQMKPEMGPPLKEVFEFEAQDLSWDKEWVDFTQAIQNQEQPFGNIYDAYSALKIVKSVYKENP